MENVQVLKITRTKEIIFSAVFTMMAVWAPMLIHYFGGVDGGRKFLPMPFFVLLAGLLLGWRAGLVTALASASISFFLTGMPKVELLPFVTLQLAAYGFVAGLLKEKYNVFLSASVSIVSGWLAIGIALFLFSEMNVMNYVVWGIKIGIFGILLQLILVPLIVVGVRHLRKRNEV
ncbi:MAG: ECF transporter S component [Candidatus Moranbacteria bacterium]|nr:ECF transporter S component [Candidatus Moranbacteria bacterium]